LADADEAQASQPRPAPCALDRGLVRVSVRGEESGGCACGKEQPGGREIRRRVAGAEFAEVEDAGEGAVRDDYVRRMQVTVEPERRARPFGGCDGFVPDSQELLGDVADGAEGFIEVGGE
jgi:hypothetical protein